MGQKVKGGMWCAACHKPVMGVKNTHKLRNALVAPFAPVTSVFSLSGLKPAGMKVEGYVCPSCGGPVRKRKPSDR